MSFQEYRPPYLEVIVLVMAVLLIMVILIAIFT
jgi:hypothetical protein